MLLQLAAYVALLIASKMGETCPLRMKSLANLTGRMFTPLQVSVYFLFPPLTFAKTGRKDLSTRLFLPRTCDMRDP